MVKTPKNILNISSFNRKLIEENDCGSQPSKSKIAFSPSRHIVHAILYGPLPMPSS